MVEPQKIACAFPELRCTFDGVSIVPDIAVFVWSRIPTDDDGDIANVFPLTPEWTVEILSPEPRPTRVTKNILRCLRNGAEMGWLMDPEDRSVFVYQAGQEVEIVEEEAVLPMPMFMFAQWRPHVKPPAFLLLFGSATADDPIYGAA